MSNSAPLLMKVLVLPPPELSLLGLLDLKIQNHSILGNLTKCRSVFEYDYFLGNGNGNV